MRIIPNRQAELLEQGKEANFSLYFTRMTQWRENKGELKAEYQSGSKSTRNGVVPIYDSAIIELGSKANNCIPFSKTILQSIHNRQTGILLERSAKGDMVWEFRSCLLSPYVSGLGAGHPTETGIILDRNSGLPYIPASSLKGVLRLAHAIDIADIYPELVKHKDGQFIIDDNQPTLRRYFGDMAAGEKNSARGQLVFLDAFPASLPTIKADIMNPHFGKYYAEQHPPEETDNPIPVKFLAVKDGVEFIFRCFASPLLPSPLGAANDPVFGPFDPRDEDAVCAMYTRALHHLGVGSKTSIGYGRFTIPEVLLSADFKARATEEADKKRQEEEKNRQQEEEKDYPWRKVLAELQKVTDWNSFRKSRLDNEKLNVYRSEMEVGHSVCSVAEQIYANNPTRWTYDYDQIVAEWLLPSNIVWESKCKPLTDDILKQLEEVSSIIDWNSYEKLHISIAELSRPAAKKLKEIFVHFKWNDKKSKNKKRLADWKELDVLLRKMG